jgi:hypothetical protein
MPSHTPELAGFASVSEVPGCMRLRETATSVCAILPHRPPPACRRGAAIAGLAFGVLHNNGGRNVAFAAWASLVGCSYGALFLATGSVVCPALAHALSNAASAAMWKAGVGRGSGGGGGSA